jgi:small subunit ribosomal protein S7
VEVFETALGNVKPMLEVRSKRVGGSKHQVPMQVDPSGHYRWLSAGFWRLPAQDGQAMSVRLASELLVAYRKEGAAMTTRENVHRMAEANKAFAHFAW